MGNNNRFSGFLDGYRAQNLANVEATANFHWEQMRHQVAAMSDAGDDFNGQLKILTDIFKIPFSIKQLQITGEAIKTLVSMSKPLMADDKYFKALIYHYFEAAETTTDAASLRTAIEIGEVFKKLKTK